MLEFIEKLINEHGSSTILKERLELFSDKYEMLEEKNKHLVEKNTELEEKIVNKNNEIRELKEKIESLQLNEKSDNLEQIEVELLKILFESNKNFYALDLAHKLNQPVGNIEYHLQNLLNINFIGDVLNILDKTQYFIDHAGREYIIKNT